MSMTRQEQLDSVVRNYGEWPSDGEFDMAFWRKECNRVDFLRSNVWGREYRAYGQLVAYAFTRAEVEARKTGLQNKPSWDDAPKNATCVIQSDLGDWNWILKVENLELPVPCHEDVPQYSGYSGEVIGDWRDTLENRPEQEVTPEECEKTSSIELKEVPFESALNTDLKCYKPVKLTKGSDKVEGVISDSYHKPDYVLSDDKKEELRIDEIGFGSTIDEGSKWNGEGLPPVGDECYVQLAFNDMGKCLITYMGDGVFCYRQVSSGNEYTGSIRDTVFRPVKSDREKWICSVKEKSGLYFDDGSLGAIYDAGLAKLPES